MIKYCHVSKAAVAALVCASMMLSGCAQNADGSSSNIFGDIGSVLGGSDANATPAQRALYERESEYAETRLVATAVGAGLGALAGAAIGAAANGRDGAVVGAGVGAVAGGAAGYQGGAYLVRDHQNFTASRESLEADIAAARADSAEMRRNVDAARGALSAQRSQINAINSELRAGAINESAARERAQTAARDVEAVRSLRRKSEERVAQLERSIATYRSSGYNTSRLNRSRRQQQRRIAELRRTEQQMIQTIDRLPANIRPSVAS